MDRNFIILILCLILLCVIVFVFWKYSKRIRFNSINMVNGGVGAGKTCTCVHFAIKNYKRNLFRYYIRKPFLKLFKKPCEEKPLLYSNIPLFKVDYVPLTEDLIKRNNVRFNYKSTILISESSLVANSQDYKDVDLSQQLTLFLKLIRHETRGGCVFVETQSRNDNHYAFDRSIDSTWYITKAYNVPFFRFCWIRQVTILDNVQNVFNDDIQEDKTSRLVMIPKSIFKKYDSYCYAKLSDSWDTISSVKNCNKKKEKFKRFHIPTFHKYREIVNNNKIVESECDLNG